MEVGGGGGGWAAVRWWTCGCRDEMVGVGDERVGVRDKRWDGRLGMLG